MIVNNFCKVVRCIWRNHYGLSINESSEFVCKSYSNCTFIDEKGRLKSNYYINIETDLIRHIAILEMDKKKLLNARKLHHDSQ
jgi:hypothetical protein